MNIARLTIGKTKLLRTDKGWQSEETRLVKAARAIANIMPADYYPDLPAAEAEFVAGKLGAKFELLRPTPKAEEGIVY